MLAATLVLTGAMVKSIQKPRKPSARPHVAAQRGLKNMQENHGAE